MHPEDAGGQPPPPLEQHCSARRQVCEGNAAVTERQRHQIYKLAAHFPGAVADLSALSPPMDFAAAERWIEAHNEKWMALPPSPPLSHEEFMAMTEGARR